MLPVVVAGAALLLLARPGDIRWQLDRAGIGVGSIPDWLWLETDQVVDEAGRETPPVYGYVRTAVGAAT